MLSAWRSQHLARAWVQEIAGCVKPWVRRFPPAPHPVGALAGAAPHPGGTGGAQPLGTETVPRPQGASGAQYSRRLRASATTAGSRGTPSLLPRESAVAISGIKLRHMRKRRG